MSWNLRESQGGLNNSLQCPGNCVDEFRSHSLFKGDSAAQTVPRQIVCAPCCAQPAVRFLCRHAKSRRVGRVGSVIRPSRRGGRRAGAGAAVKTLPVSLDSASRSSGPAPRSAALSRGGFRLRAGVDGWLVCWPERTPSQGRGFVCG